ncbi:MAG: Nramp family divalent metal transporter [Gemmataceae bacterium]
MVLPDDDGSPSQSLEEVHGSVPIPKSWWRRLLAFSGPALMVSVGYMDPGNWGTDLAAGSKYGYQLLWVLLMSNLMALLLQTLATRLGVVTGRDLAQACRERYPRRTGIGLWLLAEIAIIATDLAEVIGTIVGLKLLLGVPYLWGLGVCALDTFLLLLLQRRGVRLLELITLALVAIIAGSFFYEIVLARPDLAQVLRGFAPGLASHDLSGSLYVAIGMLGATVMPHNLYLHSALVQTRAFAPDIEGKSLACRYNFFDSLIALNAAFFVNASIVVLAAAAFHARGQEVESLQQAHQLLGDIWGAGAAAVLFAVALLASGQSSTLTGTISGQVVMEGFVRLRIQPWLRRLITRSAALLPAVIVLGLTELGGAADAKVSDERLLQMLVLSQVTLSFQLPFAIIPLIQLTSDRRRMGIFANGRVVQGLAWLSAFIVVGLNVVLIGMSIGEWAEAVEEAGHSVWWVYGSAGPLAVGLAAFLVWVSSYPYLKPSEPIAEERIAPAAPPLPEVGAIQYRRIGVGVEFGPGDRRLLDHAVALARAHGAPLVVIHVVEGPGATYLGEETADRESRQDEVDMRAMVQQLANQRLRAEGVLGYGSPPQELIRLAEEKQLDLLVLGSHGHRFLADIALGETVSPVLHRIPIPVLVIPTEKG